MLLGHVTYSVFTMAFVPLFNNCCVFVRLCIGSCQGSLYWVSASG